MCSLEKFDQSIEMLDPWSFFLSFFFLSSSSFRAFLQFLSLLPFLTEKHGWVAEMEARPHGEAAEETGDGSDAMREARAAGLGR
jgi:hypothetical protein